MKAFCCCFNEYQYFLRYIYGILTAEKKPLREFLVNLTIHRTRHPWFIQCYVCRSHILNLKFSMQPDPVAFLLARTATRYSTLARIGNTPCEMV